MNTRLNEAKDRALEPMSGILHQLVDLAHKIEEPDQQNGTEIIEKNSPVIRVDLDRHKILIESRESITTALILQQK